MRRTSCLVAAAAIVGLAATGVSTAHAVPGGFTDSLVQGGFSGPTALEVLPGGRIAVLEKGGSIEIVQPGGGAPTLAVTLPVCSGSEMGLLSMALDPAFATNGYVYVYRTRQGPGGSCTTADRAERLSRFTMTGDTIDPSSEVVLIDNVAALGGNHNGGTVELGRDGYLYLSIGDSGSPPRGGAQDRSILNGKILRITTTGAPAPGNPFLTAANHGPCATLGLSSPTDRVCEEIYAYGLRNPFRMGFDPNSASVRFRINDVGQSTWEEVDDGIAGANYGWSVREGFSATGQTTNCSPQSPYTDPVTAYGRSTGTVIVGGAFIPNGWWGSAYDGGYLFSDGGTAKTWLLPASGGVDYGAAFADASATDMSFGTRAGERALFYVNVSNGQLRKIVGPNAVTSAPDGPAYVGGPLPTPPGQPEPPTPPVQPPVQPQPGAGALVYTAYPAAQRVLDTRNAIGGPVGRVVGGQTRTVALQVPAGASAALVNITLDNASGPEDPCRPPSYLVAWKPGTSMPATSNANVGGCDVAANTAVLQVDASGATEIQVYADVDVIVDVLGYYTSVSQPVSAGRFVGVTPSRLLDTRSASATGNEYTRVDVGNTSRVQFAVAGRAGVPVGATTVSLTVTAIGPGSDASGYVTAFAGGTAMPTTSTVNHIGGLDTRANLALVPIGADGTVELYLYQTANVVVDVGGWITSASDAAGEAGRLRLSVPTRIADSRNALALAPLAPNGQVTLEPIGVPAGATGLVQNVTMVSHAPGWICATPNPWTGGDVSIQNARQAGQDRPALTFTTLGAGPAPRLRYCSQDSADVIVDVFGWFQ